MQAPDVFRTSLKESFVPATLRSGCPCRFPRFRFLAGFFHRDFQTGPVSCVETEIIVDTLFRNYVAPFKKAGRDDRGRLSSVCSICQTKWIEDYEDYSISFYRSFVKPTSTTFDDLGAAVIFPFPLALGFYSFQMQDQERLLDQFEITDFTTFARYFSELGTATNP